MPIAPLFDLTPPGEILNEEYIEPFRITQHHLAVAIGVPPHLPGHCVAAGVLLLHE